VDDKLDIFIGWDSREPIAYDVARQTIADHASIPVDIRPIKVADLIEQGVYTRDVDPLASTEFTYSRFFTPWLACFNGWALFCDCDFLFLDDVAALLAYRDPSKAVMCVKHDYVPKTATKMDGKVQTTYPRKNWSSFMLFNCAHPSTKRLTPDVINSESGAYLHRMQWAADDEIGAILEREAGDGHAGRRPLYQWRAVVQGLAGCRLRRRMAQRSLAHRSGLEGDLTAARPRHAVRSRRGRRS
jgi:hypothetical protein